MVEEYELYPFEQDVSNTLILYRSHSVLEPLYLNVRELGPEGIPVEVEKSNLSDINETSYEEKTGFYDEPEFVRSNKQEKEIVMQGYRIDKLENEIDKISSVQEMERWVALLGGVIVGLILMFALIFLNPYLVIN